MQLQEIEVFIEPDGRVRIEVHGIYGMDCLDLTKELEIALGGQIEDRKMKADAYEQATNETQNEVVLRGAS